jgi:hypothetical protein
MRDQDRKAFAEALTAAAEVYGKGVSEAAAEVWFVALREVSIEQFRAAMMAHMRDPEGGQFMPKPADVIRQIQGAAKRDGRPAADEAFAMLPKSERDSAVWTQEMATAWFAGACDLYATDRVGARMAFRESYERACEAARQRGEPVTWTLSLGQDPHGRAESIRKGIEQGRLAPAAAALVADQSAPAPAVLQAIAGTAVAKVAR